MGARQAVDTHQSVHAHLKDFRNLLFIASGVLLTAGMVAYVYRTQIIDFLMVPLGEYHQKLAYLTPGGGFSFTLNVIMWTAFAVALPVIIVLVYRFIAPALPERAQRKSFRIIISSILLMIAGAAFGYLYAIPGAMRFLLTFAEAYVDPMLTAESYLNFLMIYTIGLGILFQIPLLMTIINWIKPLKPMKLLSIERYVIVAAFVLAAVVTPTPDPLNQTIIAAPIVAMYQVGFFSVVISQRSVKKAALRADKKAARLHKEPVVSQRSVASASPPGRVRAESSLPSQTTVMSPKAKPPVYHSRLINDMKPVRQRQRPVVVPPRAPRTISTAINTEMRRAERAFTQPSIQRSVVRSIDGVSPVF